MICSAANNRHRTNCWLALGAGLACAVPWSPLVVNAASGMLLAALVAQLWRQRRRVGQYLLQPLPGSLVAVLAIAAAAAWQAGPGGSVGREMLQLGCLLGLGVWVGRRYLPRHQQYFATGLGVGLASNAAMAVWQQLWPQAAQPLLSALYGTPEAPTYGPVLSEELCTGLFPSHNLYAAFVVIALPLVVAALPGGKRAWRRGTAASVAIMVLATTMQHAGFLLLLLAGPLLVVALRTRCGWARATASVAALCVVIGAMAWSPPTATAWQRLQPFRDDAGQARMLKRLAIETAAALESIPRHPLGTGPGSYKASIQTARIQAQLPHPYENRVRRDSNSQYVVLAVEYGPLLVLAFLVLLASASLHALQRSCGAATASSRAAGAGSAAALVVLCGTGLFTVVLVQATGVLAGLVIGLGFARAAMSATVAGSRLTRELPPAAGGTLSRRKGFAAALLPCGQPVSLRSAPQTPSQRLLYLCCKQLKSLGGWGWGEPFSKGSPHLKNKIRLSGPRPAVGLLLQGATGLSVALLLPSLLSVLIPATPPPEESTRATAPLVEPFYLEAEATVRHDPIFVVQSAFDTGGGRVLSIPGGSGKNHGQATYRVQAPTPGHYKLWLRVYWEGGCGNSIDVQIAGGRRLTVEDTLFNRWHWVDIAGDRGFELAGEPVELHLFNVEDGVHIDQIAFTAPYRQPVGIAPTTAPIAAVAPSVDELPLPDLDIDNGPVSQGFDKYGGN